MGAAEHGHVGGDVPDGAPQHPRAQRRRHAARGARAQQQLPTGVPRHQELHVSEQGRHAGQTRFPSLSLSAIRDLRLDMKRNVTPCGLF